jgi:hypothetical protein
MIDSFMEIGESAKFECKSSDEFFRENRNSATKQEEKIEKADTNFEFTSDYVILKNISR